MAGDFIDLRAWQEAKLLATMACQIARRLRGPGASAFANQLVRSALSVPANVAEGHGRGIGRDCARFLRTARASAAEAESHLLVAVEAGYLSSAEAAPIVRQARFARFLVSRLLKSVDARAAAS